MSFAEKVKLVRTKLKLSQEDLARELGVSFATINRWENGKTMPTKKHLCIIENVLKEHNIDFKELVENE